MTRSVSAASLGFPRIGAGRELKWAVERFWRGEIDEPGLHAEAAALRRTHWARQRSLGIDVLPSNDFSLYDQVLDTTAMVGAVPAEYGWTEERVSLDTYFAMARGRGARSAGSGAPEMRALEMTKWFDTNYHYLVPELTPGQVFRLGSTKPVDEFTEALAAGFETRPVLIGPVTYLLLSKGVDGLSRPLTLLEGLLPVYREVLSRLAAAGASWIQMDEPSLVLDLDSDARAAYRAAYAELSAVPGIDLLLTTYFGALGGNADLALSLPVSGLHLDLVRGGDQLGSVVPKTRPDMVLSLGAIDGRNVWKADLEAILDRLEPVVEAWGPEKVIVAPSCSLLHVPVDRELEQGLDSEVESWLAFAVQKVGELDTIATALSNSRAAVADKLEANREALHGRRASSRVTDHAVRERTSGVAPSMARRVSFVTRQGLQHRRLGLPVLPTTTIGSFPQGKDVRHARNAHRKGELSDADYRSFVRGQVEDAVRWQEEIGLDVLVHGEAERSDMVHYFGERLNGFADTEHGWVQSYGSRGVRPPIIYGDVSRPEPMTVEVSAYAQSLTDRPMKGMLTGPITLLQWSFVRSDIPREDVARQIALALRDEVVDLEAAGLPIIQIDEPALREGLPLRRADRDEYLRWAVEAFRLASSGVRDDTQIHTHMCYAEFNDIIQAVADLDADVISIETTRSQMALLDAFVAYRYPNEIGPGVYDIHSPRIPEVTEMVELIERALTHLSADQLWVNPDCGLKTRSWAEVKPAVINLVAAAKEARERLSKGL